LEISLTQKVPINFQEQVSTRSEIYDVYGSFYTQKWLITNTYINAPDGKFQGSSSGNIKEISCMSLLLYDSIIKLNVLPYFKHGI
jgi:hypothetical protein